MTCEECYHRPICKRCPADADICAYAIAASQVKVFDAELDTELLPKNIKRWMREGRYIYKYDCPNCGRTRITPNENADACPFCGQRLKAMPKYRVQSQGGVWCMKSVLISIRPEWCMKIASGKKTIEVRKTRPKCETPFKCYIYCTKAQRIGFDEFYADPIEADLPFGECGNGKVIGEFICDRISEAHWMQDLGYACVYKEWQDNEDCMTNDEMLAYMDDKDVLYGWHISELKIYDEPKGLWEFCRNCNPGYGADCKFCKTHGGSRSKMLQRPPQSWCYVEGAR